jgi:hypothetical protein
MNYKKLVPPDSFIGQYMEYMSYIETATSYDFWCAMWAIGTGVGRGVYVDRPNSAVRLNWYIILAAESGTTRKSTAINSICKFISSGKQMLGGKTSPESLELLLHDCTLRSGKAEIAFAVSELVTILGREGYMSSMPGLLTDLYDCPSERRSPGTLKSGEIIQKDVYVTFLSASTPSWLVTSINPSVIEGGFTSRVIFVVDDNRKRAIAWPEERRDDEDQDVRRSYERTVQAARTINTIQISIGGLRKFRKWYNNRATHTDPFLSSFEAREDDHVLRAAGCLAINDGTLEIQAQHITKGIQLIIDCKSKSNNLFGGDFSQRARLTGAISRIREILIESSTDGIRHSALQRRVARHLDPTELRTLMNIMHECGMVQIFKVSKGGTMYRATKSIEKFGVASEVLAKLNLGD